MARRRYKRHADGTFKAKPKRLNRAAGQVMVETVELVAANGRHIRMATRVTLENGKRVTFMERVTKKRAISQARDLVARGYSE